MTVRTSPRSAIARQEAAEAALSDRAGDVARQAIAVFQAEIAERRHAQEELAQRAAEVARSERTLRDQTRILQSILDSMGHGVIVIDEKGKLILFNPEAQRIIHGIGLTETTLDEWSERYGLFLPDTVTPYPPQDLPAIRAMRGEAANEVLFVRNAGVPDGLWVSVNARPLRDETGCLRGGVVLVRDITERIRAEQALHKETVCVRLMQAVAFAANEALSVGEAMQFAVDQVCAHARWPVGHVYMLDSTGELASTSIWHLDDPERFRAFREVTEATRFSPGAGLPGWVLATGNPAWIMDVTKQPNFDRARHTEDVGVKGGFAFPVLVEMEVVAVLEFFSDQPAEPDEPLLEVMSHIGALLGRVVERKRAEEALASSEARTRLIIDTAYDAFVAMDTEGHITDWNSQAEMTFGWSREEAIGRRLVETIIPPQYRDEHVRGLREFLATGRGPVLNKRLQVTALHRDGHEFPVELAVRPTQVGGTYVFNAFIHDITARRLAEEGLLRAHDELELRVRERTAELSRSNRQLKREIKERGKAEEALAQHAEELSRSNAELEQFAYVASHDLKEPLRMVSSYLELLKRRYDGRLDNDADDFIGFAVDGAVRMRALIDGLLAISRVGTHGKSFSPVDCEAVLKGALADLQVAITESGAVITSDKLPVVLADGMQLEQLFLNLVSNAIKFRSARQPRVRISARRRRGEWLFSVRDNGIGIDEQYADRIFVIFQRLHGRADYPGTGIGLAICKKIVERHGGRIWVESRPGKGSTFNFTIQRSEKR